MPTSKVGWLWLDRPPLNIVSYRGRSQIAAIMEAFGQDPDVRVVVIRGKNGIYTSGGDVKAFPQIERDGMSHLAWNIAAPERCPKPVICAMEKYAMGVGLELAMACDIRLATKDTVLALPEVTLGQIPGSGGSQRVARIAGLTRAVDMMMLGRRIPAPEAHAWGLVTRVAEDSAGARPDDRRGGRARSRRMSPLALKTIKRVLEHLLRHQPERGLRGGRPRLREAARKRRLQGRHRRLQREAKTQFHRAVENARTSAGRKDDVQSQRCRPWRLGAAGAVMLALSSAPRRRSDQGRRGHALSGSYAPIGKQVRWGAELAVKEINAAGGVKGRPFELLFEDEEANPPVAVRKVGEAAAAGQGRSAHRDRQQRLDPRGRPGSGTQRPHPGYDRLLRAVDHRLAMQPECLPRQCQCVHAVERIDRIG